MARAILAPMGSYPAQAVDSGFRCQEFKMGDAQFENALGSLADTARGFDAKPNNRLRPGRFLLMFLGNRICSDGFSQDTATSRRNVPNASFPSFEPIVCACSLSFRRCNRATKFAPRCEPRDPIGSSQTRHPGWMPKHSKYGNQSNHEL